MWRQVLLLCGFESRPGHSVMAKKTVTKPEPDRVKYHGDWEDLAAKMVRTPSGKAPARTVKKRKSRKA